MSKPEYPPSRTRGLREPWKPGQSGNPGGQRRKKPISDRYELLAEVELPEDVRKLLKMPVGSTYADAATLQQFRSAIKGDTGAIREIRESIEGKATIRITGEEEAPPIEINVSAIPKYRVKTKK